MVGMPPGTIVAGKYRITSEIGRGGMGVVYRADDLKLGRAVALKFLPADLTDDAKARERFINEAHSASVIDNPHICTIYEIGESGPSQMFIAMSLCNGESLKARIRRGPLLPAEALSLAVQAARGLAAAHENGIVHRDVKPGNILISRDGTAKIADFGLAKIAGEARLTRPGTALGTISYMSPEQIRGEEVDARSDVWSLGVVLYEMLTGELPFRGENEQSMAYSIVHGLQKKTVRMPPGIPAGCVQITEKAMARDPGRRFASAGEMAEALDSVITEAGLGSGASPKKRLRRRHVYLRAGLAVVLAAAAIYAVFAFGVPHKMTVLFGLAGRSEALHVTVFTPNVLGDDPADEFLAGGLAQYLRRKLNEIGRRSGSWVTPVEHLEDYEVHEAADARRVLGANVVVSGTFKRTGDNLSLTLDVIDPNRYRRLASLPKSDNIANMSTWQVDLVIETASLIGLPNGPGDRTALSAGGTTVPKAFEYCIRGLGFMAASETSENAGEAIAAFEESLRFDPSFVAAGIGLAEALWRKYTIDKDQALAVKAESQVRAVLKVAGTDTQAMAVLGGILHGLGRMEEAAQELERALALDPLSYDIQMKLGSVYESMMQPEKALAAYQAAQRIRPGYWAAAGYLGYFYFFQGAFDKARDEFEKISRLCPGNILGLNNLGAAYYKLGDNERAEASFERSNAVKRNPDACSNLAFLYFYRGRYADAVTMNEEAISFGLSDYLHWGNLADAYHFTPGNESKAAEAYRKAIELAEKSLAAVPADSHLRASLAEFLAKSGLGGRALSEIGEALRAKPGDSLIVRKSALVYELTGARPLALKAIREYVRLKGPMEEITKDPFLAGLRQAPEYVAAVENRGTAESGPIK